MAASLTKIEQPGLFAESVANYRLLPPILVSWVAIVLPWLELVAGSLLVLGWMARSAALVLAVLLTLFAPALLYVLVRGLGVDCGCFYGNHPVSWVHLVLDVALWGVAVGLLRGDCLESIGQQSS